MQKPLDRSVPLGTWLFCLFLLAWFLYWLGGAIWAARRLAREDPGAYRAVAEEGMR